MGHYVNFAVMPLNTDIDAMEDWRRSEIIENNDYHIYDPNDSCIQPLHILNQVVDGYENARHFLDEYAMKDRLGYTDAAVHLRDRRYAHNVPKSSKLKTLEERLEYLTNLRQKTHDDALPSKRKGKRITCTKCESALTNSFLGDKDRCPVCGNSLLSPSITERLASIDARLIRCKNEIKEENDKLSAKASTMWLVRASCHC